MADIDDLKFTSHRLVVTGLAQQIDDLVDRIGGMPTAISGPNLSSIVPKIDANGLPYDREGQRHLQGNAYAVVENADRQTVNGKDRLILEAEVKWGDLSKIAAWVAHEIPGVVAYTGVSDTHAWGPGHKDPGPYITDLVKTASFDAEAVIRWRPENHFSDMGDIDQVGSTANGIYTLRVRPKDETVDARLFFTDKMGQMVDLTAHATKQHHNETYPTDHSLRHNSPGQKAAKIATALRTFADDHALKIAVPDWERVRSAVDQLPLQDRHFVHEHFDAVIESADSMSYLDMDPAEKPDRNVRTAADIMRVSLGEVLDQEGLSETVRLIATNGDREARGMLMQDRSRFGVVELTFDLDSGHSDAKMARFVAALGDTRTTGRLGDIPIDDASIAKLYPVEMDGATLRIPFVGTEPDKQIGYSSEVGATYLAAMARMHDLDPTQYTLRVGNMTQSEDLHRGPDWDASIPGGGHVDNKYRLIAEDPHTKFGSYPTVAEAMADIKTFRTKFQTITIDHPLDPTWKASFAFDKEKQDYRLTKPVRDGGSLDQIPPARHSIDAAAQAQRQQQARRAMSR